MAALSAPVDSKKSDRRKVSIDTLCSSNSCCVLQKRKQISPLAANIKFKNNNVNSVKQRLLSAKVIRFKTLQNELNDANYHIAQLINENKLLQTLQKRQDHALARYEGSSAELPKMIESHQEEIRALQTRNKTLRKNIKDLNEQVKSKDEEVNTLKDQNKHLLNLVKNKNLEDREKLTQKVEELEDMLRERNNTISTLNRKIVLETKSFKFKLGTEMSKNKSLQKELFKANEQIEQLTPLPESTEKNTVKKIRRNASCDRKRTLLVKLNSNHKKDDKSGSSDKKSNSTGSLILSSEENESCDMNISENSHNGKVEIANLIESKNSLPNGVLSSELQLKNVVNNWQKKCTKQESIEENLNVYCTEVMESANTSNKDVDKNTSEFKNSEKETESLLSVLRENDEISMQLSSMTISSEKLPIFDFTDLFKHNDKNSNVIINKINSDSDRSSKTDLEENNDFPKTINLNNKPDVLNEDKEKLLAKLRAIDNGENLEFPNVKKTKNDLLKELFG